MSQVNLSNAVRGCGPEDCVTTLTVHILVIIGTQVSIIFIFPVCCSEFQLFFRYHLY